MFSIETNSGRLIHEHSYFETEEEILLAPGRYLQVVDQSSPASGLHIVHLREITPPFPLLADPFDLSELKHSLPEPIPLPNKLTTQSAGTSSAASSESKHPAQPSSYGSK